MKKLRVNIPGREYDIFIQEGLLKEAGKLIRPLFRGEKAAVVTDSNVGPLYGTRLTQSLKAAGIQTRILQVPAGEASKSSGELFRLYDEMLDFGMTRSDLVVALGGGVVGDLAGYAAASLLRGIPFVQIPTTVLAQVDSSVGGKVAIDLPRGKNLVGAFYQPKLVLIDPCCLETLTPRVLSDGMAEVIKYGAIWDSALFARLEKIQGREALLGAIGEIVYTCCEIKRQVVEEDELDTGGRMILNFGHTFGHAIEREYHYETYTHGEAVAIGMVMACGYGERQGITPPGTQARMEALLRQFRLPTQAEMSPDSLRAAMAVDKKGDGGMLNLILLREIGSACIEKINKAAFVL